MELDKAQQTLQEIKARHKKIWDEQDIKSMALESIDSLCIHVEDGMDKEKALEMIYRFSHCASDSICHSSHEDWRKELKDFYYAENIQSQEDEGKKESLRRKTQKCQYEYYEDVFFKIKNKEGIEEECCDEELALSILLKEGVLFSNSRDYVEWDKWEQDNLGKFKHSDTYHVEGETIVLFVLCNDLFWWACADGEKLKINEVGELYRAWRKEGRVGVDKWCCKKRNMKPQKPIRDGMKECGTWEEWMDKLEDPGPS